MYGHGVAMERHTMTIFYAPLYLNFKFWCTGEISSDLLENTGTHLDHSADKAFEVLAFRTIHVDGMIDVCAARF